MNNEHLKPASLSSTPSSVPKLSLFASYDDMCRFSNSLQFKEMQRIIGLLKNFEEVRKKWAQALKDLRERDTLIMQLQHEAHKMNIQMQHLRMAFAREVKSKESLQRDYNDLKKKMQLLREMILDEDKSRNNNEHQAPSGGSSRSTLMSMLQNLDQPIKKQFNNNDDDDDSNDGLLFDKSDDNIDVVQAKDAKIPKIAEASEQQSVPTKMTTEIQRQVSKASQHHCETINEVSDERDDSDSIFNTGFIGGLEPNNDDNNQFQNPSKNSTTSIATIKSNGTITLNRCRSTQITSRLNLLRYNSKLEPDRLNTRPHHFQEKKAFKSQNCSFCCKNIGFYTTYFVCTECRGLAHNRCKDQLPRPCLPYISGYGVRRMLSLKDGAMVTQISRNGVGKLLMIGDFTNMDIRPCVPALLIHCCNEIDRRIALALKDKSMTKPSDSPLIGLYRICGIDREVRELRNKILEAKHGIPNLTTINDVHTICGVIKMFLRDLEESLVTKVLWHDFVRASEHVVDTKPKNIEDNGLSEDPDKPDSGVDDNSQSESDSNENEPIQVLKEVILQMPVANRDSLAFLMLHLRNVASAERVTKMTHSALANIFAPTIVGSSEFRQISSSSLVRENSKQVIVMNALFEVNESFWNRMLKDKNFSPFEENRRDTLSSVNGGAAALCSKLAKISSSNLKSLLQQQEPQGLSVTSKHNYKNLTNDTTMNSQKKPSMATTTAIRSKRTSIDYIRETVY